MGIEAIGTPGGDGIDFGQRSCLLRKERIEHHVILPPYYSLVLRTGRNGYNEFYSSIIYIPQTESTFIIWIYGALLRLFQSYIESPI